MEISIQDRYRGAMYVALADVMDRNNFKDLDSYVSVQTDEELCVNLVKEPQFDVRHFLHGRPGTIVNPLVHIALRFHRKPEERFRTIRRMHHQNDLDYSENWHDFALLYTATLGELIEGKTPHEAIDFAVRHHAGRDTFTDDVEEMRRHVFGVLEPEKPEDALRSLSLDHGGTAGGLIGARLGYSAVSAKWEPLYKQRRVLAVADVLFNCAYGY